MHSGYILCPNKLVIHTYKLFGVWNIRDDLKQMKFQVSIQRNGEYRNNKKKARTLTKANEKLPGNKNIGLKILDA